MKSFPEFFLNLIYMKNFFHWQVQKAVERKCKKQHEKDKFKTYIGDMEKIILLLLKVSGLLARAENALQSLPEDSNERLKVRETTFTFLIHEY